MPCANPFDVLRLRVEDLGPQLYLRASYKDPWLNLVPRGEWPVGAGLVRSAFTIGRSEPSTDEETWSAIQTTSGSTYIGSCNVNYVQTYVGEKETTYAPEEFGLVGPPVCQDDFTLFWDAPDFWEKYFQALEKRNQKSIINRLANIYMTYSTKAVATTGGTVTEYAGNINTQPPGAAADMSSVTTPPSCGLSQDILDNEAIVLSEIGADQPNTNGWITQGESGPEFPILIGQQASNQILLNNAELRSDYRQGFMGWGDANPVIQRIGASRIIKNFRHIITRFPPRWSITDGTGALVRVPTWIMSTNSNDATKGQVAIINPDWQNANIAAVEGAIVLNPWVYTEEILQPVNSMPGMKLNPQNYMGQWNFVTGNDAFIGFDGCTGIKDPMHKQGRHFAEYRHAAKPLFPEFGRTILFKRCPQTVDCVTCS